MAKNIKYTSIRTVIPNFIEDYRIKQTDLDEDDLLKWATDKAMDIIPSNYLVHRLAWLDVNNYKADKPKDLELINEVAYRTDRPKTPCGIKGYQIVDYVMDTHDGCELELSVNCPACHKSNCDCALEDVIVDIDRTWEISHPEIYYDKYVKVGRFGYATSIYDPSWKILCYSDNPYFGLNKHLPGCSSIYCTECPHSYMMDIDTIETSFEQGEILLSYMGRATDEEGKILIPDHRDVHEAILHYIAYKYFNGEWIETRDPSSEKIADKAKALSDQASDRAISRLSMPSFAEFSRFWYRNKWSKIESAYHNLLDGKAPIATRTNSRRNPARS